MSFTPDALRRLYEEHASPDKMVLTVVGDVKAEDVRKLVEANFGQWTSREETEDYEMSFLPPVSPAEPEIFNIARDKEQVHIIIGFLGTTLTSEDRFGLERGTAFLEPYHYASGVIAAGHENSFLIHGNR